MTDPARALLEQALKLPEAEREKLALEILESVGGDESLPAEWIAEIDRRIEKAVAGRAAPEIDWRTAMDEIRREVERKRGGNR